MTAISPLAATPGGETTFARLDRKTLFARPETLVRTVEELFNLFIAGRIKEAIDVARARQRETAVVSMAKRAWAVIEPVITWIGERDIKLGFLGAKIEVRRSRGR